MPAGPVLRLGSAEPAGDKTGLPWAAALARKLLALRRSLAVQQQSSSLLSLSLSAVLVGWPLA